MQRAILSLTAVLAACASAHAGAQSYFPETAKDFGTTPRGPVLTHYFPVTNTSSQPISLGSPRVSCGCVSAQVAKYTLAPGESTTVVAYMDSRRIPQAGVPRTVTVFVPVVSGGITEEMQLRVTATAQDNLVLSSDTFAFGTVRKGQGGKATTKITVYNSPGWQVSAAESSGIYIKAAAAKSGDGTSVEVTAVLDPACPVGNWTADVWLRTTAPGVDRLRVPVTVNVIAPIDVKVEGSGLATALAGKPTELKVVLQATQAFKITGVKGAVDGVKVAAVPPIAKPVHILLVTVTPGKEGDFAHSLEIATDHPDMPKVVVPVAGKARK